ncbi:DUF1850 domain-containing protein [Pelagibacterium mangrovi]|uniref:DUF1850 domain-containing protein n=1 Tax=Pelagibacterium mangrovi TaxID=3119828 RepID=UPI002FCADE26
MMLCIAASGKIIALAATAFSLSWTHSVERTLWQEQWVVTDGRLQVVEGTVQGSGAGIYLPENAKRTEQGWAYTPALAPLASLSLAASGTTPSNWTLCTGSQCLELGPDAEGSITLWAGTQCSEPPDTFE